MYQNHRADMGTVDKNDTVSYGFKRFHLRMKPSVRNETMYVISLFLAFFSSTFGTLLLLVSPIMNLSSPFMPTRTFPPNRFRTTVCHVCWLEGRIFFVIPFSCYLREHKFKIIYTCLQYFVRTNWTRRIVLCSFIYRCFPAMPNFTFPPYLFIGSMMNMTRK